MATDEVLACLPVGRVFRCEVLGCDLADDFVSGFSSGLATTTGVGAGAGLRVGLVFTDSDFRTL